MKRLLAIVAACCLLGAPASGLAQEGFGLGVILGEPTGVSAKLWLGGNRAVAAAAAWSLAEENAFQFHADYLWHNFALFRPDVPGRFALYYGVGGRLKIQDEEHKDVVGARFPLGLAYHFPQAPVDLFVEVVPALDLLPDTGFDLDAALGARFYFR